MPVDFSDKTVLITGGTRGIGLQTALAFARYGAQCIITYRWGDHDEAVIQKMFADIGGKTPLLIQANAADKQDTHNLISTAKQQVSHIDIFISNVAVAMAIKSFEDYSLKGLKQSISYSSWPIVSYTLKIKEIFGQYPKYIIGVSSTGPDAYSFGYDFVAASKAVLEILCRYLSHRLKGQAIVNAVRSRAVKTQSLNDVFGKELESFMKKLVPDNYWIEPEEIANSIVGLCSGYCDIINGQIITVDRGTSFFDNFMDVYTRYQDKELELGK